MLKSTNSGRAWSLLVASPAFDGDVFEESVVLLADDTFGVVVNAPMNRTLGEISPQFSKSEFADIQVYDGGPVGRTQLTFAAWFEKAGEACGFSFGISPEAAKKILSEDENAKVCAFLGYAGWGEGQLQSEIADGTWIVSNMDIPLVMETPPEKLWEKMVLKIEPRFKLLNAPCNGSEENN